MKNPRLLSLFCCQGGDSVGYSRAGFEVVGVDLSPQPKYPYQFYQLDATRITLSSFAGFDLIHASPPCQLDSDCQRIQGNNHPDLIGPTRDLLERSGKPYVIENVRRAVKVGKLRPDLMLCGAMFGMATYRHRFFELGGGITIETPPHPVHVAPQAKMGRSIPLGHYGQFVGNFSGVDHARRVMDVPWMNRDGIRECIPPAYAEYIGEQFLIQWGA